MASRLITNFRNVLIAGLILALAGYVAYSWSHRQGIRNLQHDTEARLTVVSAILLAPTDKYSYLPGIIAAHPMTARTLLNKHDPAAIHDGNLFLQRLNTDAGLAVIYLLDDSGMTIAASNWQSKDTFIGHNYSFRPYFQDAIKEGDGKFYAMGTISLVPGYYLSRVVKKGDAALGVLVIKINMDSLDSLARTPNSNHSEVTVTDENGIAFLSTVADWKYRPKTTLGAEAQKKVNSTRQYEGVLKPPLPIIAREALSSNEKIVDIEQSGSSGGDQQRRQYLVRSEQFSGSPWMVNVFVPMEPVNQMAMRIAGLTVVIFGLLVLALMYLLETRSRIGERERSRLALQRAHQALEQKHAELERVSEDLRVVSITDSLTGAYNRRYFLDVINKLGATANQPNYVLSIMMIDVDYFKRINDVFGHPTGDRVLQLLTVVCKQILRTGDVFARFGGEEFIMAFPGTDEHAARQIGERLRASIMARSLVVNDQTINLTVSCGISRYRSGEAGMAEAIKRADEALYEAKSNGRNQVVVRV